MEYQYSSVVDPSQYETDGLCDGIALRIHQDDYKEDLGAIRAREDWREHVGPLAFHARKASLGPKYNFLAVAYPETLPDRMEVLAYFNEFIFLQDDIVEAVEKEKGDAQNDEARDACLDGAAGLAAAAKAKKDSGRRLMVAKASKEMLAIDAGPARVALALWAEWFDKGAGRENKSQFATLEEYLEYRILDVGKMYLTGVLIFAMGLNIPDHEDALRSELCRPAWIALGLVNDLYSLDKELEQEKENKNAHVLNSLRVLMHEHGIGLEEARALCRQKVREYTAQFVQTVRETKERTDISLDLRVFVDGIQYVLSGNLVWTKTAPRYNPGVDYNARQREWMANGAPKAFRGAAITTATSTGILRAFQTVNSGILGIVRLILRVLHMSVP